MEPRLSFVTLGVADLERSTRFYAEGLGLPGSPPPPPSHFLSWAGPGSRCTPGICSPPTQAFQRRGPASADLPWRTTSARWRRRIGSWTRYWRRGDGSSARRGRPTGAGMPATSPIQTASSGRWPGIRSFLTSSRGLPLSVREVKV